MKKNTKGGRRQPEERLQRRPDLPRSRLRRRPDGQERVPHTNREIYKKQPDHGRAYAGGTVHSDTDSVSNFYKLKNALYEKRQKIKLHLIESFCNYRK